MQVQELVETALQSSTTDGCIVIVSEHTETNVRWAANSLTTNGQMRTRNVTVAATIDRSDGTHAGILTRSVSNADELEDLVRAAETAARAADVADDAAPIVSNYDHNDDWDADPATTSVAVFEQFASGLGSLFKTWAAADLQLFGFAEHQMTSTYLGTSTGLRRRFDQPDGRVEVNGKSPDYARSAFAGQHTVDFADVDIAAIGASLEQRLGWAERRIDLRAGRYETILPPSAVADMMINAYAEASARDASEGRSVYSGPSGPRIGDALTPLPAHLYSDPSYAGIECAPFQIVAQPWGSLTSVFDNGVPLEPVDWISDGRLANLIGTRAWSESSGVKAAQFVDNLILDAGGTVSLDEMVAATERGLLLTTLWYMRTVDPQTLLLTGLTRDGVYLVENGTVSGAVNNFRFNESPIDLLARATEAGQATRTLPREMSDYFRRTAMPALRVPDFNMSTVSAAS